jgi:hypothetical protein
MSYSMAPCRSTLSLPPRLLLPPLPCTQPCTELGSSGVTGSTWWHLETAWISQIRSLVTDHNPRVAGSSPASGTREGPAQTGFRWCAGG